jgi:hypothetical protein
VFAAARGGRQLPRPEQLKVARRTLALSLRGCQVAAAATYVAYSAADWRWNPAGVLSTRFRFMIAVPFGTL